MGDLVTFRQRDERARRRRVSPSGTLGEILLFTGVRYEHDRVQRWTINYPATGGTTESYVLDKTLRNTTWRVGGVYQPTSTISLYAQYATGVDPLGTLVRGAPDARRSLESGAPTPGPAD